MNIFYAPPSQIQGQRIELTGQEANHAARVLRFREGDAITVVDGEGGWYRGRVQSVTRDTVAVAVEEHWKQPAVHPPVVLGMGILKKRDRMEFAVEKAVELGVSAVVLFRSDHTVKENVRIDRLESAALSAMKQSLRSWLPKVSVADSIDSVLDNYGTGPILIAHEKEGGEIFTGELDPARQSLLLIGPEGGFSHDELSSATGAGGEVISLGDYRLRAETAVVAALAAIPGLRRSPGRENRD